MIAARTVPLRRSRCGQRLGAAPGDESGRRRREMSTVELVTGDRGASVRRGLLPQAAGLADGVLEGASEFERQDAVEDGIDDCADVVQNSGDVEENGVEDGV